jgi:hypothetical protein
LAPSVTSRYGHDGANGSISSAGFSDPAHRGPLPDATFPELVGRLINDVSDLADRQIELAKQEIAEAKDETVGVVVTFAIGAGIAMLASLLLIIWIWAAVIWFFNWVGAFISIGPITLAWLGWLVGLVVPLLAAWIAYQRFIRGGMRRALTLWPALPRTRATLKEHLEWLRTQRLPSRR